MVGKDRILSFGGTRARSPLSPGFLRNEDDEPRKQRRGQIGDAVGGDGHDAIWSGFFGFRPKQNGEGFDHCCFAWNKLIDMPWKIMSIGTRDWVYRS